MKYVISTALPAILLAGCIIGGTAGRGTVVDNEVRTGFIYLAGGNPAAGARVRVIPVGFAPDSGVLRKASAAAIFSTRTDADGRYQIDSLPAGEYNILGESDGLYSLQDSVYISPSLDSVDSDTLDEPGSISGVVVLQPQDNPISVVVQALGTNSFANVGEDGRFTLANLGAGRYTLRIATTLDEYTPLTLSARVRAGKADTLADSIRLPFTGIPVVQGLRASYDTLSGVVTLTWHPVRYRSFSEYQIFRDRSPALSLSESAVASTLDTVFHDRWDIDSRFAGASYAPWEYRVRVKSLTDRTGPAYGKVVVDVVDPASVVTQVNLVVSRLAWDAEAKADRYIMLARLTNRGRGIRSIAWSVGDPDDKRPLRNLGGTHEETDTLAFSWERQGPFVVYVETTDGAGSVAKGELRIPGNQAPILSGGPVLSASTLVPYQFAPKSSDPDGDPLLFTIAGKPAWAEFDSLTGTLRGTPSADQDGVYPGITISAHDGRRTSPLPSFEIRVGKNPHALMKPFPPDLDPRTDPAITGLGGKIYAAGQWPSVEVVQGIRAYDPSTETWTAPEPLASAYEALYVKDPIIKAFASDSLIYLLSRTNLMYYDPAKKAFGIINRGLMAYSFLAMAGGKGYFMLRSQVYPFSTRVQEYDFKTGEIVPKAVVPAYLAESGSDYDAIPLNGKIFVLCGFHNKEFAPPTPYFIYDPEKDAWSMPAANPRFRANTTQCAINGKIYVAGGEMNSDGLLGHMDEYDPAKDAWRPVSSLLSFKKEFFSCAEADGKGYFMLGGSTRGDTGSRYEIESYDPSIEP